MVATPDTFGPEPKERHAAGKSGRTAGLSLARYVRTVRSTSRLAVEPPDAIARYDDGLPKIVAMWHGQFLLIPTINPPDAQTDIMVARHGDGNIVSHAMSTFGLGLIRGAGAGERKRDRGGRSALRAAIKSLSAGRNVAMTADVPPGPARKAGLGIVTLARLSGRPIVPVAVATNRFFAIDTWSRFTINLPFSRMGLVVGDPIYVPRDADEEQLEVLRQKVEDDLNRATTRAYAICGGNLAAATPPSALPPDAPPVPIGFRLRLYRGLTRALSPLAPLLLRYRERKGKEDPDRRGERLGEVSVAPPVGRLVWVHAASVGETNAIMPIIHALREHRRSCNILLTTGTVTSAKLAAERLPEGARHQYLPIDTPGAVDRFLKSWRPELAILVESEIWPNLIMSLSDRAIPVVLVNARMSKRSYQRWWKRRNMARQIFSRFSLVLAQNESLTRRFRSLGARTVVPAGNIKNDAPPLPIDDQEIIRLQSEIGGRPVFLAASTHPGEDEVIIEAHKQARETHADLLTIIAPRHPHRSGNIAALARLGDVPASVRSKEEPISTETGIYVADTIGELGMFYRLSTLALIGGSLVEHGGQNPIEALNESTVILYGPHTANFDDAYREIAKHDAGVLVNNAQALGETVARLMSNEFELTRHRAAGRAVLERMSGALDRTIAELLRFLPKDEDDGPGTLRDATPGTSETRAKLKRAS